MDMIVKIIAHELVKGNQEDEFVKLLITVNE